MTAHVSAFSLGGTIGMAGHQGGVVTRLAADDLVAAVPQLATVEVELNVRNFRSMPSASLSFEDVIELVAAAEQCRADGVVVVQGTDTLEETAYLMDLLWPHDTPIVVTGAMRNPSMAGSDGPADLLAAVQSAASPELPGTRRPGRVQRPDPRRPVRPQDAQHQYVDVRIAERRTDRPDGRGPAGPPHERREATGPPAGGVAERTVATYTVTMGDDGESLRGLADHCDGLVVAALGVGHVPERLAGTLVDLAGTIPVVLASRTGAGPVLNRTYGFVGSETYLLDRGLISAGLLDPYKARVLLKVALDCDDDRDRIRIAFADASGLA